jgi:hypothetical protein
VPKKNTPTSALQNKANRVIDALERLGAHKKVQPEHVSPIGLAIENALEDAMKDLEATANPAVRTSGSRITLSEDAKQDAMQGD